LNPNTEKIGGNTANPAVAPIPRNPLIETTGQPGAHEPIAWDTRPDPIHGTRANAIGGNDTTKANGDPAKQGIIG